MLRFDKATYLSLPFKFNLPKRLSNSLNNSLIKTIFLIIEEAF